MLRVVFQVPVEYLTKLSFLKPTFKKEELKEFKTFLLILAAPTVSFMLALLVSSN